jgi:polyphosphate glucokinase
MATSPAKAKTHKPKRRRAAQRRPPAVHKQRAQPRRILSVDVGGTKVKFLATGETEPRKIESGPRMGPGEMVAEVRKAARGWSYAAVSLGIPGLVGSQGPLGEPGNLGTGWVGFDFAAAFECPVRIVNDAAMQALGSYDGGRMLFLGLGTGLGSVLIIDGMVITFELGELAHRADRTISARLGAAALAKLGKKRWRKRVIDLLPSLQRAFLADYIMLGGGNAKHIKEPLPPGVRIGNNLAAFRGGFRLWGIDDLPTHMNGHQVRSTAPPREWRFV